MRYDALTVWRDQATDRPGAGERLEMRQGRDHVEPTSMLRLRAVGRSGQFGRARAEAGHGDGQMERAVLHRCEDAQRAASAGPDRSAARLISLRRGAKTCLACCCASEVGAAMDCSVDLVDRVRCRPIPH